MNYRSTLALNNLIVCSLFPILIQVVHSEPLDHGGTTEGPKQSENPQSKPEVIPEVRVTNQGVVEKVIKNSVVKKVYPDGILFMNDEGLMKIPFSKLPAEFSLKYGYDPEKAKSFTQDENKRQNEMAAALEKDSNEANRLKAKEDAEYRKKEDAEQNEKNRILREQQIAQSQKVAEQRQQAEDSDKRATALRQMQRAMRSGDRNDVARAMRMLQADAPDAVQGFNDYLAAKAARAKSFQDEETRRKIDDIHRKINGF